jgi:hypothetical protein
MLLMLPLEDSGDVAATKIVMMARSSAVSTWITTELTR